MKNNGGPAFPAPDVYHPNGQIEYGAAGISIRDYFAAKAITGYCPGRECSDAHIAELASWAYRMADAMILERNKP